MKFNTDALRQLNETKACLADSMERFPWESRLAYVSWMAQHYNMVEQTMKMLELASALSKGEEEHMHWFSHLRGEINHHKLFIHDAKALGADLLSIPALPQVSAMVYSVHGGILMHGSHWLLGQALVLEGMAVTSGEMMAKRISVHGVSKFVSTHVEDDIGEEGHFEKGIRYMMDLPIEKQREAAKAIAVSGYLYSAVLSEIVEGSMETGGGRVSA